MKDRDEIIISTIIIIMLGKVVAAPSIHHPSTVADNLIAIRPRLALITINLASNDLLTRLGKVKIFGDNQSLMKTIRLI